jgi:signal transduction histidine kinase
LLHGPIQSALVSSAIKLQNSNLSTADAHKLNEDIAQAVSHIQGGYKRNNNFDEALMQLRGIWSRIVDIEVSVSDDARSRLELDQTLSGSLAQVLVEAVSNAKKHGQASHVSVEIEIDAADNLVCSIYNNGLTISENAQDGLGSTLFDELCLFWQRVNTENGVTLIATF